MELGVAGASDEAKEAEIAKTSSRDRNFPLVVRASIENAMVAL